MNWKNVIAEIQRHGQMTQPQIAEKVGCSQATISDLVNSKTDQPRYPLGAALIELLHAVTPTHGAALQ
jgi:predicted XRE-type DNA-binding protein